MDEYDFGVLGCDVSRDLDRKWINRDLGGKWISMICGGLWLDLSAQGFGWELYESGFRWVEIWRQNGWIGNWISSLLLRWLQCGSYIVPMLFIHTDITMPCTYWYHYHYIHTLHVLYASIASLYSNGSHVVHTYWYHYALCILISLSPHTHTACIVCFNSFLVL